MKFFKQETTFESLKKPLALMGIIFMGSLTVLVVVGIIGMIFSLLGNHRYGMNTITVTGQGEVAIVPDSARFTFSFVESNDDVLVAQEAISEKVQAIMESLDIYVEERDMRTRDYRIQPRYDWVDGQRQERGFEVTQQTEIIVRDTESVGSVLAILGEARVTNLGGPFFEVADEEVFKRQAHTYALRDARLQAEEMASELGVRLKRIVSVTDSYRGSPAVPYDMMRAETMVASSPTPEISLGENIVQQSVDVTYRIR